MRTRLLLRFFTGSSVLLLLVLPLSTGTLAGNGARLVPTNSNVSAQLGNEAENAIAINPTNPSNIVAMSVLPGPRVGIFAGVSFDGGQTWIRQVIGDGDDELGIICCDQQLDLYTAKVTVP
jgi:hypothetical protein